MNINHYKKLIRIFIEENSLEEGKTVLLSDKHSHYLKNVMRKKEGDELRLFNGVSGEWLAVISNVSKRDMVVTLKELLREQSQSSDIQVIASVVKKSAFDLMIEKSCELGASKFIPVTCNHTVVSKIKPERLQTIAIEAAEQSERLDVMQIDPIGKLKDIIASNRDRELIFCLERSDAELISKVAIDLKGKPVSIVIGPEGGFSVDEIEFISALDNTRVASLGTQVLRAETALIAALSVVSLV